MTKKKTTTRKKTAARPASTDRVVDLDRLTLDPGNSCLHDKRNLEVIEGSIRELGAGRSILMDADGIVRAGNGTAVSAKAAGITRARVITTDGTELIVVQRTDLTGAKAVAAGLADNRASDLHTYDAAQLKHQLEEIGDLEIDLCDIGLADHEVEDLLASLGDDDDDEAEEEPAEEPLPEPPAKPITKAGDLWQLGEHRLLCGDSTSAADIARLLAGSDPQLVFTDPPYSSGGFQESGKTAGSIGARNGPKIENDNLSTRAFLALLNKVFDNLRSIQTAFVFCDWKMWGYNVDVLEQKGLRVRSMIVWDKMQMGMGMPFRNQHELCVFGSRLAGKIGNGKTPNVLQFPRDREADHVTPKPVGLIVSILRQVESETVIDPFMGGGSTLIAAEQLGRKCFGMEISPAYCDVIVKRWERMTERKAERIKK